MNWLSPIGRLVGKRQVDAGIAVNERVVFFPTVGCRCNATTWQIPIHGWIYQPTELSRLRRFGLHLVNRVLRLKIRHGDPQMPVYRERMGAMLADNEGGQRVCVKIGESVFTLNKSRPNGHFHGTFELPASRIHSLLAKGDGSWLDFRAVTLSTDPRNFDGRVLLLPSQGLSVISDIDDTIKISEVGNRRRLLRNTFLNAFASVPDMSRLYQQWQKTRDAAFHYVSASPWHLYPCLSEFMAAHKFPAGSFHLRSFRLAGRDLATAFRSARRVKSVHIRQLLECCPRRKFVLVGDSGEADPEMYAYFARSQPWQIEKIFIRNITGEPADAPRWRRTFSHLSREKWQIFSEPGELR